MRFSSRATLCLLATLLSIGWTSPRSPEEALEKLREMQQPGDPEAMRDLLQAAGLEESALALQIDRWRIELPTTSSRKPLPSEFALFSISADGQIRVSSGEERAIPLGNDGDVISFAAGLAAAQPGKPFLLRADRAVPYQRVDLVFDAMKRLKINRIFLLTAQDPAQKDGSEWPSVLLGGIWLPLPPWDGASD